MTGNGNNPETRITAPEVKRLRASGPILILAVLFLGGAFLTWYFTWFGRSLTDADISQYLLDEKHPRRVQHALLQVQQRIDRGDGGAKQWYPEIIRLAAHPETEFRLTVAWLMGFDSRSEEFHQALRQLLGDSEPIVRRNAALALVRFNDTTGRAELLSILKPFELRSSAAGEVASTLKEGSTVARGTLLARITQPDKQTAEVRSPLPGRLIKILATTGSRVSVGDPILSINSDEASVWECLRGLSLIGESADLPAIGSYARGDESISERIKQQASLTVKAIESRQDKER